MIHIERLIKTFSDIIKIDSPSGYEKDITDHILDRLKTINTKGTKDDFGNIIITVNGTGKPLFLSAHLDTVEPGKGIIPKIHNGFITSATSTILGADNKAAVAALLEVLSILPEQSLQHRPLEIVFTLSEEIANLGAINLDYTKISALQGFCFDSANHIGTVITSAPFYNRFDIHLKGRSAHASKPKEAINAVEILTQSLINLKLGMVDEESVINIGVIEGGSVRNTIPGEILLKGEVRSFSEKKLENHTRLVINNFSKAARAVGGKIETEVVRENSGYEIPQDNHLLQLVTGVMRILNFEVEYKKTWGCADSNIFRDHGIEVINLGNGVEKAHTTAERIKVTDLARLTELILKLITI